MIFERAHKVICAVCLVMSGILAADVAHASSYDCRYLDEDVDLPIIEGGEGMFFRVVQDIAMQDRFTDASVAELQALSRALEARGTTLIVALIPTKSSTMPHLLPAEATLMGYDQDTAVAVQRDLQQRLRNAGVVSVDLQEALFTKEGGAHPFFGPDTHWNAYGAELAAKAIAAEIVASDRYAGMAKTQFRTTSVGEAKAFSGMRRIIQLRCRGKVPEAITTQYATTQVAESFATIASTQPIAGTLDIGLDIGLDDILSDGEPNDAPIDIGLGDSALDIGLADAPLDIGLSDAPLEEGLLDIGLGDDPQDRVVGFYEDGNLPIAIVGTSFSDLEIVNYPGFVAQHSSLETVNYAITGGGKYSAITSYLTSEDFQSAPPAFLVWESPIYLNPALNGDQPMRELIAAAGGTCVSPMPTQVSNNGTGLMARVPLELNTDATTLYLDTGNAGIREVTFRFRAPDGRTRNKTITRGERMRQNGRFYVPLTGLWSDGPIEVEILASQPIGANAQLYSCPPI